MITHFVNKHKGLSYYQGFNFMAEVFLMTYGKNVGYCFLEKISLVFLNSYFDTKAFSEKLNEHLIKTYAILLYHDSKSLSKLKVNSSSEHEGTLISKFAFMLSWYLCWFSYKISNMTTILRIFDYLVCSSEDSVAILSAVVISKMFKDDPNISKDTKVCDLMDYTFSYKLDNLDWEELLQRTTELKK